MNQAIALVSLIVISFGVTLGNYWYTFGLWPKSWTSFVLFAIAQLIVSIAMAAAMKSED